MDSTVKVNMAHGAYLVRSAGEEWTVHWAPPRMQIRLGPTDADCMKMVAISMPFNRPTALRHQFQVARPRLSAFCSGISNFSDTDVRWMGVRGADWGSGAGARI